jgi:hypothetical protein
LTRNKYWVLAILFLILIINNWSIPFWDQDEPAYAGFARNMNASGDYTVPHFFFSDDHRKTPLHFWNIALSFKIFGENEFATRFPSVLAIFGTFLLLLKQGAKISNKDSSFWAVIALGTSFLVPSLAKVSVTDATVLFFTTLTAFGIINTLLSPSRKWIFLTWLGFALGLLTKGPPIIIFAGLFSIFLFVFHPSRFNLLKLRPWFFLPVAFIPVVLWGYATYLRDDGAFLSWMYWWYVEKRISGSVYGQTGYMGTHFVLMIVFFLPTLMYFFTGLAQGFKGLIKKEPRYIIIMGWFISGWLFYEFSPSKLPAYVIAAHVPLALLIGEQAVLFTRKREGRVLSLSIVHYTLNYILAIALIVLPALFHQLDFLKDMTVPDELRYVLIIIGATYFILLSAQLFLWKSEKFIHLQFASAIILSLSIWIFAPQFTELTNSSKKVSEYVLSHTDEEYTFYIAHSPGKQPSLPFYLGAHKNFIELSTDYSLFQSKIDSNEKFVLILNKDQADHLKTLTGELDFHIISSQLIDRKDKATYYIYIN